MGVDLLTQGPFLSLDPPVVYNYPPYGYNKGSLGFSAGVLEEPGGNAVTQGLFAGLSRTG
jgi:hypothetical protein